MRIAVVRRKYSLSGGGAERYCVGLVRQFQALGQQVTVVGETIDERLRDEVEFVPVRVNHATSWTKNLSFAAGAAAALARGRFDVSLGLSHTAAVDVFRVTDRLQAHWLGVYYRHPLNRFVQRLNPRHRAVLALERSIYRSSSVRRVITESRLDQRLLAQYYGVPAEKVRTVYDGVDTNLFHPGVRQHGPALRAELGLGNEPLLVFASMDFEGKGLGPLLEAVAGLEARATRLVVVGRGRQGRFARRARQLGIADRVLFTGRRGDIERFFGAGDLLVLPTLYEPFGLVHLEALACGLPVITTATAGAADIIDVGHNGYVIPHAFAVAQLRETIDQHLGLSPEVREAMSRCCWETAREMTLERNARQTLDVLEEAVREKS